MNHSERFLYPNTIRREMFALARARTAGRIPVDVEDIARQMGVVEISNREMVGDGYLARRSDGGLAIRLKSGVSHSRRRFTIAHEVAHIIIAKVAGEELTCPVMRGVDRSAEQERLADMIAAEILMPSWAVRTLFDSSSPSVRVLMELRQMFQVSLSALLRRVTEVPGLVSVRFQIPLQSSLTSDDATDQQFHEALVRCSNPWRVRFTHRPEAIARRLLEEMPRQSQHLIEIEWDGQPIALKCIGREIQARGTSLYDVIGWGAERSVRKSND